MLTELHKPLSAAASVRPQCAHECLSPSPPCALVLGPRCQDPLPPCVQRRESTAGSAPPCVPSLLHRKRGSPDHFFLLLLLEQIFLAFLKAPHSEPEKEIRTSSKNANTLARSARGVFNLA